MSKKSGNLSGWHNFTTNSIADINGITVQDILTILNSISSNDKFIKWKDAIDAIFEHIADHNNPHHLTIEQLQTTVIRIIYETWLTYGYSGSIQYFIDLLFRYIEYADMPIMNEGLSEDHVPPVNILAGAINNHNVDLDAHADIFNKYFVGNCNVYSPTFALDTMIAYPTVNVLGDGSKIADTLIDYRNSDNTYYVGVPLNILSGIPNNDIYLNEFTMALSFRPYQMTIFQLYSPNTKTIYRILSRPNDTNTIELQKCTSSNNSDINLPIDKDFSFLTNVVVEKFTIPVTGTTYKCFVMFKDDKLSFATTTQQLDDTLDLGQLTIYGFISDVETDITITTKVKDPKNPLITFPDFQYGRCLISLFHYSKYLNPDQLIYVNNILGNVTPNNWIHDITDPMYGPYTVPVMKYADPVGSDPIETPLVIVAGGTNGYTTSTASGVYWRKIISIGTDTITGYTVNGNTIYACTDAGRILTSIDNGLSWVVLTTVDQMHFNDILYCSGYYIVTGTYDAYLSPDDGVILMSEDAINWYHGWEEWGGPFNKIAVGYASDTYQSYTFFVIAGNDNRIAYNYFDDMYDWPYDYSFSDGPNGTCDFKCAAYINSRWIVAGTNAQFARSTQSYPSRWSELYAIGTNPSITWYDIKVKDNVVVLVGSFGYISISDDNGLSWSDPIQLYPTSNVADATWFGVEEYNNLWVLIGAKGRTTKSTDLYLWSPVKNITTNDLVAIHSVQPESITGDMFFVADNSGKVYGSLDLIEWMTWSNDVVLYWYGMEYFDNKLVAVSNSKSVAISTDNGNTWAITRNAFSDNGSYIGNLYLRKVNGLLLLLGCGKMKKSVNGLDWIDLTDSVFINNIDYGNGKYIGVNGNYWHWSTDLLNWTTTVTGGVYWTDVAYGNSIWVMCGQASKLAYSTNNGTSWTYVSGVTGVHNALLFVNGKFVLISTDGYFSTTYIRTSTNGSTWTLVKTMAGGFSMLKYSNNVYVIADVYANIAVSTNLIDWNVFTNGTSQIWCFDYTDSTLVTVNENGEVYTSTDLINCSYLKTILLSVVANRISYLYPYYQRIWLAMGCDSGVLCHFSSNTKWNSPVMYETHDWETVAYVPTPELCVVISKDGNIGISEGQSVEYFGNTSIPFSGHSWYDVKCIGTTVVVCGANGAILTFELTNEYDVPTNPPQIITDKLWYRLYVMDNKFVVISSDGFIMSSDDGIIWSDQIYMNLPYTTGLAYGNGIYVCCGANGNITHSTDMVEWSDPIGVTNVTFVGVVFGRNMFVAYTASGNMYKSHDATYWEHVITPQTFNPIDMIVADYVHRNDRFSNAITV